jgi:Stage II sporulation protein M
MNATGSSDPPPRSAPMTTGRRATGESAARFLTEQSDLARLTATVSATTAAGTLLVAAAVRATIAAPVRDRLGYTFPGVPAHLDVAIGIFANNGRVILGVLGLLLVAQISARTAGGPPPIQRVLVTGGELILTGVAAANVLVVGAALGAYGQRMLRAVLPHGPIELAAYSLALGLYLEGRRRRLPAAHLAKVILASVVLLAVAALLETFVSV